MATYTDPTNIVSTGKAEPMQPGALVILVGGILATLFAVGFFVQSIVIDKQVTVTQSDIATKKQQLSDLNATATDLQALSNESKDLHSLFDNQKRWEAVLDKFSERLDKDMAVTSLQLSDKGTVSLSGIVPDYFTYAKVFQAFTDADGQKYFSVVRPTSVNKVYDGKSTSATYVTFSFNMTMQASVLNAGSFKATP